MQPGDLFEVPEGWVISRPRSLPVDGVPTTAFVVHAGNFESVIARAGCTGLIIEYFQSYEVHFCRILIGDALEVIVRDAVQRLRRVT